MVGHACMISSQLGHPFLRKSTGSWMMEHNRQALSCFDLACDGIVAVCMVGVTSCDRLRDATLKCCTYLLQISLPPLKAARSSSCSPHTRRKRLENRSKICSSFSYEQCRATDALRFKLATHLCFDQTYHSDCHRRVIRACDDPMSPTL